MEVLKCNLAYSVHTVSLSHLTSLSASLNLYLASIPSARKVKVITYCGVRCVFVCVSASRVCTHMRSKVFFPFFFFHQESNILACELCSPPPCPFFPSQGRSPHAKEKKWGVKGSEFPLDLLLYAPSVPSLCHSALDICKKHRKVLRKRAL